MVAMWLMTGFLTLGSGLGLFAYSGLQWLTDGQWQASALADYVRVPLTRSLLGLNQLLELAFSLPLWSDLVAVGLVALLVGSSLARWHALIAPRA
jgi:hypothetical protein